jgi:hypothetical protein
MCRKWKHGPRNDKIFSAKDVAVEELFDKIQISL